MIAGIFVDRCRPLAACRDRLANIVSDPHCIERASGRRDLERAGEFIVIASICGAIAVGRPSGRPSQWFERNGEIIYQVTL